MAYIKSKLSERKKIGWGLKAGAKLPLAEQISFDMSPFSVVVVVSVKIFIEVGICTKPINFVVTFFCFVNCYCPFFF